MKDKIYKILPDFLQGILISTFNLLAYKERYGGRYSPYLKLFKDNRSLPRTELESIQKKRFTEFLYSSKQKSRFYKDYNLVQLEDISKLPILKKEQLRQNIEDVVTIAKKDGIVSKTGGTTGKSLEIIFTKENMQERFAMLDDFRSRLGYELGKKTAWFSGKNLLTSKDLKKNRFWKTDLLHKVRYYSTFHIKDEYLKYFVQDLIRYQPEFLVGFPSSILEIAKYGIRNGYDFPENTVRAIFPTAETITAEMRTIIEGFFKTKMFNQYASSEGAPFIFECSKGNLHLELQSGVFEVLDEAGNPTQSGRLVVTSFTTEGTPLIRYDIGDSIVLDDSDRVCDCGNNNPLVKEILGRVDDYIYSPQQGKINLGNVSNTLKDTKGIIKFQVVQDHLNEIDIFLQVDPHEFSNNVQDVFMSNWRDRVGNEMMIRLHFVENFEVEKSGKFRMVKNNIKQLLND